MTSAGLRVSARNWVVGARLKTMPATFVPIAVGTAVAASSGEVHAWRTVLTVLYALGFVLGTNYFNDYSDGIRGTDANRVGPARLVGSGRAEARQVLRAGQFCYATAAVAAVVLAVTVSWSLLVLAVVCALGGWFYTGGAKPYGYRGLGEVSVFLFHGVIAVCATTFIQLGRVPPLAFVASVSIGLLVCSLLVSNNLRDIPTDAAAGKYTLAVAIGDGPTRVLYLALVAASFVVGLAMAVTRPWVLLVVASVPFAVVPVRRVRGGARGRDLVAVLEWTCLLLLVFGTLLTIGLAA